MGWSQQLKVSCDGFWPRRITEQCFYVCLFACLTGSHVYTIVDGSVHILLVVSPFLHRSLRHCTVFCIRQGKSNLYSSGLRRRVEKMTSIAMMSPIKGANTAQFPFYCAINLFAVTHGRALIKCLARVKGGVF